MQTMTKQTTEIESLSRQILCFFICNSSIRIQMTWTGLWSSLHLICSTDQVWPCRARQAELSAEIFFTFIIVDLIKFIPNNIFPILSPKEININNCVIRCYPDEEFFPFSSWILNLVFEMFEIEQFEIQFLFEWPMHHHYCMTT